MRELFYPYRNPSISHFLWRGEVCGNGKSRLLKHDSDQTFDDYSYDAHGNITSMPHLSGMVWDEKDQLFSAKNSTFTSYYNYDDQGVRTRKVVEKGNIVETRYYINGYEVFRKETNNAVDFERTTLNISDDEKVFVSIEKKTNEPEIVRYQYDNHLGSACLELDTTGQIISYEEYHPFGTTSYRSGRKETEVSLKRYKYCGKERDEETGLYYYGMRYYASWICRFVSVDPLQFKYPELTPFQYASNRPITMIDLDGGEGVDPLENQVSSSYPPEANTESPVSKDYALLDDSPGSNIRVEGKEGQSQTLEILKKAFGKQGENFSFNYKGELYFRGDVSKFSKAEMVVFLGLNSVMKSSEITEIIFEKNAATKKGKGEGTGTIYDNPKQTKNIIYVDPEEIYQTEAGIVQTPIYKSLEGGETTDKEMAKQSTDSLGQVTYEFSRMGETLIYHYDSKAARFFHGIGHVIHQGDYEQTSVIQFDNAARSLWNKTSKRKGIDLPRTIDSNHINKDTPKGRERIARLIQNFIQYNKLFRR